MGDNDPVTVNSHSPTLTLHDGRSPSEETKAGQLIQARHAEIIRVLCATLGCEATSFVSSSIVGFKGRLHFRSTMGAWEWLRAEKAGWSETVVPGEGRGRC